MPELVAAARAAPLQRGLRVGHRRPRRGVELLLEVGRFLKIRNCKSRLPPHVREIRELGIEKQFLFNSFYDSLDSNSSSNSSIISKNGQGIGIAIF